jgi:hypothetical protein
MPHARWQVHVTDITGAVCSTNVCMYVCMCMYNTVTNKQYRHSQLGMRLPSYGSCAEGWLDATHTNRQRGRPGPLAAIIGREPVLGPGSSQHITRTTRQRGRLGPLAARMKTGIGAGEDPTQTTRNQKFLSAREPNQIKIKIALFSQTPGRGARRAFWPRASSLIRRGSPAGALELELTQHENFV